MRAARKRRVAIPVTPHRETSPSEFPVLIVAQIRRRWKLRIVIEYKPKGFRFPAGGTAASRIPSAIPPDPGPGRKKGGWSFYSGPFFHPGCCSTDGAFPLLHDNKNHSRGLRHNRAECGVSRQYGKFAHKSGPLFKGAVDEPLCKNHKRPPKRFVKSLSRRCLPRKMKRPLLGIGGVSFYGNMTALIGPTVLTGHPGQREREAVPPNPAFPLDSLVHRYFCHPM